MKILITGGTGRLAEELKKHLEGEYVGIEHFDFTFWQNIPHKKYDLIVHAGAYTDVALAEKQPQKCFLTNAFGTFNMVHKYMDTPFIYISTEYCHEKLGVYAHTKYLGEEIVKTHPRHLILRTSFKPNIFPFAKAYTNQYTQGDEVGVIAKLLAERVKSWKFQSGFEFLGTGRKTIFELAQKSRPDVQPMLVEDYVNVTGVPIPHDYIPHDYEI